MLRIIVFKCHTYNASLSPFQHFSPLVALISVQMDPARDGPHIAFTSLNVTLTLSTKVLSPTVVFLMGTMPPEYEVVARLSRMFRSAGCPHPFVSSNI